MSNLNEEGLDVISLTVGLVGGDTLLPHFSGSLSIFISQITNDETGLKYLRFLEEVGGKIPIVHIQDVCDAHIFCLERCPSFRGRFLCASDYVSPVDIAKYYQENYPEYYLKQE